MSYQEIYRGLNKRASVEQVRQLAQVIGMKKKAAGAQGIFKKTLDYITPNIVKDFGGRYAKGFVTGTRWSPKLQQAVTQKFSLPGMWQTIKRHPIGTTALLTAGGAVPATAAIAGAGKEELKGALDRANTTASKLVQENKNLKVGSGSVWGDIYAAIMKMLERWGWIGNNKQQSTTSVQEKK